MDIKDVEYYMQLPYALEVRKISEEDGGGIFMSIPMLKGCMSDGACISEAYENLQEAQREWITNMLERNLPIPEPLSATDYSGKFIVRLPKSLHKLLAEQSALEGVSLNQYVTTALAYMVGLKKELA